MKLADVIEGLVEERGLDREHIVSIICDGMKAAYIKKFPNVSFIVQFNNKTGETEVFAEKEVVSSVEDPDTQITLRRARIFAPKAEVGSVVEAPFEEAIGRIEVLTAKQVIATKIRELEHLAVYEEFKDRQNSIVTGMVHKRERGGFVVKVGEVMALLPKENVVSPENIRIGGPVKVLLKEVLQMARGDYQLILDRASADFVQKLIELEIPEVYEGIVEIKKIVRIPGYKTKAMVVSSNKDIDPVGTCVGVGGARIKPILRELGQEKIDLIQATDMTETLVKDSLKPAEIDKVEVEQNRATVWLAEDQRSLAIGKQGQNISLASRLTGLEIQLQDIAIPTEVEGFYDHDRTIAVDDDEPEIDLSQFTQGREKDDSDDELERD